MPVVDLRVWYTVLLWIRQVPARHGVPRANDQVRLWVRIAVRQEPPDHDVRAPVHYGDTGDAGSSLCLATIHL